MKKLLLILLCLPMIGFASFPINTFFEECDNIILKDGKEISAKVIEITPDLIKYKKCSNLDGPTHSIYKSEVLILQYNDGSRELFNTIDNKKIELPITSIISITLSLISLFLPIYLESFSILFSIMGLLIGTMGLKKKYWGIGLTGMLIGLVSLIIILL